MPSRPSPLRVVAVLTGLGLVLVLTGCSGGQFGAELSARAKPQLLDKPGGMSLHVPKDQTFNLVLPRASKEPGLKGEAQADATAKPSGEANVTAAVKMGGKAEGVFQLGHAIANATDLQADTDVRVKFKYSFEAEASGTRAAGAVVGLRLYARSGRGPMLRDIPIADYTTDNGSGRRSGEEEVGFRLTLGPGEDVTIYLAGQAHVEVPDDRSASCSLQLNAVELSVATHPAPAVQATKDAQH
jgi:hypothetical protein